MTVLDQIKRTVKQLPVEKQNEVLDFAAFLSSKIEPKTRSTRRSLKTHPAFGLWKDRNIDAVNYQQNLRSEWDERQ